MWHSPTHQLLAAFFAYASWSASAATVLSDDGRYNLMRKDASTDMPNAMEERFAKLEAEVADLKRALVVSDAALGKAHEQIVVGASGMTFALGKAHEQIVVGASGIKHTRNLADRVDYLERKLAGSTNWLPDPQLWRHTQYECKNHTDWKTQFDMRVCLDGWDRRALSRQGKPCVVYDLGIRAQPNFGLVAAQDFNCMVRAYDPSPTTQKWWDGNTTKEVQQLKELGESKYKLWKFAAGGTDGPLELFEYNWQQVSIFKEEDDLTRSDAVKKLHPEQQSSVHVPAKTLPTMLVDNGDTHIDVLKVDIEGSEYMFFQDIFDRMGCPPVQQITVEYHHFSLDDRYGSSPEVNTIHKLLNDCGYKCFYTRDHWRNKVESPDDKFYLSPKRYTVAAYCKDCGDKADEP